MFGVIFAAPMVSRSNGFAKNTIKLVQKSIPKLRSTDLQDIFLFTILEHYGGALVQISEEMWPDIVDYVKTVEVNLESDDDGGGGGASRPINIDTGHVAWAPQGSSTVVGTIAPTQEDENTAHAMDVSDHSSDTFSVTVRTASYVHLELGDLRLSSKIGQIKSLIAEKYGVPAALQVLQLFGGRLKDTKTLAQSGVTVWTILDLALHIRQSRIFIFPDYSSHGQGIEDYGNIEVRYSLNRAWEVSALFPEKKKFLQDHNQTMIWNVSLANSTTLFDHELNGGVDNLFWDGISKPFTVNPAGSDNESVLGSPPPSSPVSTPLISPMNSSAVPFDRLESYISAILSTIGLKQYTPRLGYVAPTIVELTKHADHLGAFRSILPHLKTKNFEYLALRFIVQDERFGLISITPPTNKINRVLMVYKGLNASAAAVWNTCFTVYKSEEHMCKNALSVLPTDNWYSQPGLNVTEFAWMENV
ncbi:hypothetical protein FRC12_013365 [Ceratobasidium sp. 428]|nr:hypothetical protein FRC12_013365 [Ceratobasidium sp. 428]